MALIVRSSCFAVLALAAGCSGGDGPADQAMVDGGVDGGGAGTVDVPPVRRGSTAPRAQGVADGSALRWWFFRGRRTECRRWRSRCDGGPNVEWRNLAVERRHGREQWSGSVAAVRPVEELRRRSGRMPHVHGSFSRLVEDRPNPVYARHFRYGLRRSFGVGASRASAETRRSYGHGARRDAHRGGVGDKVVGIFRIFFERDGVHLDGAGDLDGLSATAAADIGKALELAKKNDVYLVLTIFSFDNFRPDKTDEVEAAGSRHLPDGVECCASQEAHRQRGSPPRSCGGREPEQRLFARVGHHHPGPEWAIQATGNAPGGQDFFAEQRPDPAGVPREHAGPDQVSRSSLSRRKRRTRSPP